MDPTLYLYKDKLKEALTLVPNMSQEKKLEAVNYWNDVAKEFEVIVNDKGTGYEDDLDWSHGIPNIRFDDMPHLTFTNTIEPSVIIDNSNLVADNSVPSQSPIVAPIMSQTTLPHFHGGNSMEKNSCDTPLLSLPSINLVDELDLGVPSEVGNGLQTDSASNESTLCFTPSDQLDISSANDNSVIRMAQPSIDRILEAQPHSSQPPEIQLNPSFVTFKSQFENSQLRNRISSNKSINIGSGAIADATLNSDTVLSRPMANFIIGDEIGVGSPSSLDKLVSQNNLVPGVIYHGEMIGDTYNCSKTLDNLTDDIGNGQFDRGPGIFNNDLDCSLKIRSDLSITPSPGYESPNLTSIQRCESFTQSDRPLQQIQFAESTINSETLDSYRTECLANCHEQTDICDDIYYSQAFVTEEQARVILDDNQRGEQTAIANEHSMIGLSKQAVSSTSTLHTCDICGKSGFSTKGNLKRHLRAHSGEKPFKCDYCDSCFTEKKSLKIHVRRHTGEKPYKCEICGKLFSQTGVLQSHMALHLNERKFECNKCGKAFRQRSQLKLHLMRHDGVKRLECPSCMARFLTKGDLERHCRIHTGERPYACKICGKTFTRQQSLNEHMNRHTGRKPYDCKYCDKSFSEMSACYKHAKTHKKQA